MSSQNILLSHPLAYGAISLFWPKTHPMMLSLSSEVRRRLLDPEERLALELNWILVEDDSYIKTCLKTLMTTPETGLELVTPTLGSISALNLAIAALQVLREQEPTHRSVRQWIEVAVEAFNQLEPQDVLKQIHEARKNAHIVLVEPEFLEKSFKSYREDRLKTLEYLMDVLGFEPSVMGLKNGKDEPRYFC